MKTMIVDDEPWMLTQFKMECGDMIDVEVVGAFGNPLTALEFAKSHRVELAFLDIEMPEMDGLTLATRLRECQPDMIVIFFSAYESYMADAFRSHGADYFIMKPYDRHDVESAIDRARLLSGRLRKRVCARTFGQFDLFVDGVPVAFPSARAKELMALIIDCRGGVLTQAAACKALWPSREAGDGEIREYRRMLREIHGVLTPLKIDSMLEQNPQGIFLHTDVLDCDLYQYLDGDMKTIRQFAGAYMTGYPWAAGTLESIRRQNSLIGRHGGFLSSSSLCACVRCRLNDALTMTYTNESFQAICGYTRGELEDACRSSLRALILREDYPAAIAEMQKLRQPGDRCETEFRLRGKSGGTLWVLSKCELLTAGTDGAACGEAECLLIDISGIKAEQSELMRQAQRDSLTGLLNRAAAQSQIEQYIQEHGDSGSGALILMDVDHFKAVNDTYGHPFADTVLTDIAALLSRAFRAEDVVSRLGGDEMLVFLKDSGSIDQVKRKIDEVIAAISARLRVKTDRGELSCSFGVAVFPDDAGDYASLYQKADLALYCAKEQKGCAVLYANVRMRTLEKDARHQVAEIESHTGADAVSPQDTCFRILPGEDVPDLLRRQLAEIGKRFDISRVYIFEVTGDGRFAVNTFEWCADGIEPQIAYLQQLSAEQLTPYYQALFENDGLFYCYDIRRLSAPLYAILEPQGIQSMLQCILKTADGTMFGMVGFDECRKRCYWNGQEIRALSQFAEATGAALHLWRTQHGQALEDLQKDGGTGNPA